MGEGTIGKVTSSKGNLYAVKWEGGPVYVKEITGLWSLGWMSAGRAASAGEAMRVAEAYLYNK